jgi:protein-tyrosine kinase
MASNSTITTDKSIGDIIKATNNLSVEQIELVAAHQRKTGLRFGEAAVALGLIKSEDVLWALSQQFQYPYSSENSDSVHEELVVANKPFSPEAELFRSLRTQLLTSHPEGGPRRALAVISPNSGDGKSFVAANLAVAMSQLGAKTVLVDADMRNPRQDKLFNSKLSNGLSSVLSERSSVTIHRPTEHLPSLYLLPVGVIPPNPLELLQKQQFARLLAELTLKFDYVIIDTPAFTQSDDAYLISVLCGSTLVVAKNNETRYAGLQGMVDVLRKANIRIAGTVLNQK